MAQAPPGLVLGTNCGFVSSAPVGDPGEATSANVDGTTKTVRDTSQVTATKITEIGWYCNEATEEANFEVGLYDNDGGIGEAGTRLYVEDTNAKGTASGWIIKTGLNWAITSNKLYWIAIQCDTTATNSTIDYVNIGGGGRDSTGQSSLPDPLGGGAFVAAGMYPIYALIDTTPATTTTAAKRRSSWVEEEKKKPIIIDNTPKVIKALNNWEKDIKRREDNLPK